MKKTKSEVNKNLIFLSLIVIALAGFLFFNQNQTRQRNNSLQTQNQFNRQNCLGEDCLAVNDLTYPVGKLPQNVKDALDEAINDEYKAYSTYEAVIKKFGSVRPFSMILRAEEQHISALKSIYDKYGLTIPENTMAKKVTVPSTIQQACQTGVDAEIANAALYQDKLLSVVSDYADITAVFKSLSDASQQKHLPAFENCN